MPAMKKKIEPGDIRQLFERLMKEIGEPVDFELPDWLNKWIPNYTIIKHTYRRHVIDRTRIPHNCTEEVLRIVRPASNMSFGIIKQFDTKTRNQLIMFEDGGIELLDLAQVDWELLAFTGVK